MTVVVDVDDTLLDLLGSTVELFNKQYNKELSPNDFKKYNIYECLEFDDANNFCSLWIEKLLWDNVSPIEGAQCGLKRIVDSGHKVLLATSTHPENFAWKVDILAKYFPFINSDDVIRIKDKSLLRADILIDDCLTQLINSRCSCDLIVFDKSWNRQYDRDTELFDEAHFLNRAHNWDEIVDIVNQIAEWNKE